MKQRWTDLIRNYPLAQRLIAVLTTLLVVFLFLPEKALFKFEYQPEQPWRHERLLAPFDFSIQKTEAQLETERTDLSDIQPPVFSLKEEISQSITMALDNEWAALSVQFYADSFRFDSVRNGFAQSVNKLLSTGIIAQHSSLQSRRPFDPILLDYKGKLTEKTLGSLHTLQGVLDSIQSSSASDSLELAAQTLLVNVLQANVIYNDSLTEKLLNAELAEIIPVQGKVNKGQAIIDRGDIVDNYRYDVLQSLETEMQKRKVMSQGWNLSVAGELGIVITLLLLLSVYISLNLPSIHNDPRPVTLSMGLIAISFAACSVAMSNDDISIYIMPIGIMPLLLRVFYDFRVSIFSFVVLTLLIALFYPNAIEFSIIQVAAISIATLYQASSTRRSRMLNTALIVFLGYSLLYTFISLAQNGDLQEVDTLNYGWFAINALMCTLVFPLVYVVEKLFGYISETTLLELGESKQALLKELAVKAPGTFQHSLQVANLAEKIAGSIGGDPVLLRTAAMYHDIGKMNEPQYFIENQLPDHNPHDELEPEESARIIIDHVSKGVEHCQKHNIPNQIIQFIRTHHGTSRVRYFHQLAQQASESEVDVTKFTYLGPKPFTKETAILMMADSIEAASRSLKKTDTNSIDQLVENIVNHQLAEGQFQEAPITFREIEEAKRALKSALRSIYHHRISYD